MAGDGIERLGVAAKALGGARVDQQQRVARQARRHAGGRYRWHHAGDLELRRRDLGGDAGKERFPSPSALAQALRLALSMDLPARGDRSDDQLQYGVVTFADAREGPEQVRERLALECGADWQVATVGKP